MEDFLNDSLEALDAQGLRRRMHIIEGPQGPKVTIGGKEYLNLCSNNYLGLADDPRLKKASVQAIEDQGVGAGASRLVCGNLSAHHALEERIARFKGAQRCIIFSTGYMANIGIISGLFDRNDIIFSDKFNHASIIDGILLSKAAFKRYPHGDMTALETMIKGAEGYKKKAVITDSVFSMDGDIAPLDRIVTLARKYGCLVMIDEAHALGVLGKHGKGAAEHFGLEKDIDIQMGTLSKAVGAFGAYCCGSAALIDYLTNKARSFIYTTAMPPSIAAACREGIDILDRDVHRREKLWRNTEFVLKRLKAMGWDTGRTQTPIIPVIVKETHAAVELSRRLFEKGILASAIRPPTVPLNTARLRVTVIATHEMKDLEYFLAELEKIGKELCLI